MGRLSYRWVAAVVAGALCGVAAAASHECRDMRELAVLEADKGVEALTVRAWRHYNGVGVPADRKQALALWEEAAGRGDARAMMRLGQPRPHGEGNPPEYATNLDRLGEAAEKQDLLAMVAVGQMYADGRAGGAAGRKQGLMMLERAAERGSVFAGASLAMFFERAANKNVALAKVWAERTMILAKKNEAVMGTEDLVSLGNMLMAGAGGARDVAKGTEYLTAGAKLGDPVAMHLLANAYARIGDEKDAAVKPDYVQARQWASGAVRGGYARANVLLAYLQLAGLGGEKDPEFAVELLARPMEVGYPEAKRMMAMMYLNGQGVMRNTWRAETLLTQAAEDGDAEAMWDLVRAYRDGDMGLARDKEKAALWLSRAYEKGHPAAKAMRERYEKAGAASRPATRP